MKSRTKRVPMRKHVINVLELAKANGEGFLNDNTIAFRINAIEFGNGDSSRISIPAGARIVTGAMVRNAINAAFNYGCTIGKVIIADRLPTARDESVYHQINLGWRIAGEGDEHLIKREMDIRNKIAGANDNNAVKIAAVASQQGLLPQADNGLAIESNNVKQ